MKFFEKAKLLYQDWRAMGNNYPGFMVNQFQDFYSGLYNRVKRSMFSGHYNAGDTSRLNADWPTQSATPTENYKRDWRTIIGRSINASDNDPNTVDIIVALKTNVIGTGIRPIPRVVDRNGKLEGVNKFLAEGWKRYNDQWAADGKGSFLENEKILFHEMFTSGAAFSNKVQSEKGSYLRIQSQIPSILRLDESHDLESMSLNNPDIANTAFGINLSSNGKAISFYLQGLKQAISTDALKMYFLKKKAEEYLPPPWLVSALKYLQANESLIKDTLVSSRIQSMINYYMPSSTMKGFIAGQKNAADQIEMQTGRILYGEKGAEPKVIQAADSVKEVMIPLQNVLLHGICMTQGLSYQTVTRDMTKMNMASAKVNNNEDRKTYRSLQRQFSTEVLQPEWNHFVKWMFAEQKIPGKTFTDYYKDPWKYNQARWQPPGFDFIDFAKESKGHIDLVAAKMETLEQWFSEWRGTDWREEVDQMAEEQEYLKEKGLENQQMLEIMAKREVTQEKDEKDED